MISPPAGGRRHVLRWRAQPSATAADETPTGVVAAAGVAWPPRLSRLRGSPVERAFVDHGWLGITGPLEGRRGVAPEARVLAPRFPGGGLALASCRRLDPSRVLVFGSARSSARSAELPETGSWPSSGRRREEPRVGFAGVPEGVGDDWGAARRLAQPVRSGQERRRPSETLVPACGHPPRGRRTGEPSPPRVGLRALTPHMEEEIPNRGGPVQPEGRPPDLEGAARLAAPLEGRRSHRRQGATAWAPGGGCHV